MSFQRDEPYPALTYRISLSSQAAWFVCPCGIVNAWSKEFATDEDGQEYVVRYLCLACSRHWVEAKDVVIEEYGTPPGIWETMAMWNRELYTAAEHLFETAARQGDPQTAAEIKAWMDNG